MFVCVGFFVDLFFLVDLRPTRDFFIHLETSQLPEKGCKC